MNDHTCQNSGRMNAHTCSTLVDTLAFAQPACALALASGQVRHAPSPSVVLARCDTPGVSFMLCREICPNLGCSVKISLSRSRMSLIIQIVHSHFTEFGVIQSHRRPNLEPVKTFIFRNECKLNNHSQFIKLV